MRFIMIDYIITDCEQFPKKSRDEMFRLIAMTKKTDKEHGTKLCEKHGKTTTSNVCVGSRCAITSRKFAKAICPKDTKEIGTFHTHPTHAWEPYEVSEVDILSALINGHKLFCMGSDLQINQSTEKFRNRIECYEIKNRQLQKLGKEFRKTEDTGKQRKIVGSMAEVLDTSPYIEDVLNLKCSMEQSNKPKRLIWNERKKKYMETFH